MKHRTRVLVLVVLTWLLASPLAGGEPTPPQRGLAIAREADRRSSGFGDNTANLLMILQNKRGQTSKRQIRIRTLEVQDDGTRSLCIFDTPRDVKGTILLTHTHTDADDDTKTNTSAADTDTDTDTTNDDDIGTSRISLKY